MHSVTANLTTHVCTLFWHAYDDYNMFLFLN